MKHMNIFLRGVGKNEFHFDGCVGGPDKSETCQLKWIKIFVIKEDLLDIIRYV